MTCWGDAYAKSCKACEIKPLESVLDQKADESKEGDECVELMLNGNALELFENRLQGSHVKALAEAVKSSKVQVPVLNLSHNDLDDSSVASIVDIIVHGKVQTLELRDNRIGLQGLEELLKTLASDGAVSVKHLGLSFNPLGNAGGMAIAKFLLSNNTLAHLDIGSTEQETESLIALAEALCYNSTLQSICVDNPRVFSHDDETNTHFANMLVQNKRLEHLSLVSHRIRCSGAAILADALKLNKTLRTLNLAKNQISVQGARALARVILSPSIRLTTLDLTANRIADQGAAAIGGALEYNKHLQHLGLRGNTIRDAGLAAVAQGLSVNTALATLTLWGNDFGDTSAQLFYDLGNDSTVSLDVLFWLADDGTVQVALH